MVGNWRQQLAIESVCRAGRLNFFVGRLSGRLGLTERRVARESRCRLRFQVPNRINASPSPTTSTRVAGINQEQQRPRGQCIVFNLAVSGILMNALPLVRLVCLFVL